MENNNNQLENTVQIDPGIFKVVKILNELGINTIASCEGHLNWGEAGPWVDVEAETNTSELEEKAFAIQNEAEKCRVQNKPHEHLYKQYHQLLDQIRSIHLQEQLKLHKLLADFYRHRQVDFDVRLHVADFAHGAGRLEAQGTNLQAIRPPKEKAKKLKAYREEMLAFAKFLLNTKV